MSGFAVHILVEGKVQGVGFRAYTCQKASSLGLRGWVRNLKDGRVEAVACGEKKNIDDFISVLKQGPAHSQVQALKVENWQGPFENWSDFQIQRNGEVPWKE